MTQTNINESCSKKIDLLLLKIKIKKILLVLVKWQSPAEKISPKKSILNQTFVT
jgi:hypothetical protein